MIAGSMLAFAAFMMVVAWLTPKLNGAFEAFGAVAYVGYLAVAIWGSVEIFGGLICNAVLEFGPWGYPEVYLSKH